MILEAVLIPKNICQIAGNRILFFKIFGEAPPVIFGEAPPALAPSALGSGLRPPFPKFLDLALSTTDSFKNKLDKFWSNQDLIYNYKAELTGIGNRSFVNNLDR